ncbi:hypothetical protein [Listeria fleischmannii]|nr:hypothetical protein [Listeria fleischmannii]EMG28710.1 hypothetical protein LFLEISCH_03975 [Listeria fleischmannii subsp. fleischmannii LU2006-1]
MAGIWNWLNSTKLFDDGQINLSVLKQLIDFLFLKKRKSKIKNKKRRCIKMTFLLDLIKAIQQFKADFLNYITELFK